MAEKVDFLLASLRGQSPPEAPAPEAAFTPSPAAEDALVSMRGKIEELERKLQELASPPAPAEGEEAAPQPPQAPTELALFLHTRVELLEKRLELAQQEALRANLILREREDAQRKAQTEVEDLFRGIREQERAARFDRRLREDHSTVRGKVEELEARLAMAQLRMIPASEVLAFLEKEEGIEQLKERLKEQLSRIENAAPLEAPVPEAEERPRRAGPLPGDPGPTRPRASLEIPGLSIVIGRMADLERRLDDAEKARERERQGRLLWENNILHALREAPERWKRAGGPELLVEASLESLVESLKKRDEIDREMTGTLEALRAEPPGSEQEPLLRAKLARLRKAMEDLQPEFDKKLAVVNAWLEKNKTR